MSSLTCAPQGRRQQLTDHAEVIKYASSFVSQMVILDFQRLPFALVVSNRSSLTIGNVILRGLAPELAGCGSTPVVLTLAPELRLERGAGFTTWAMRGAWMSAPNQDQTRITASA